jgi:hypothetical protein
MAHAKEYVLAFGSKWGFHVSIHATWQLTCGRGAKTTMSQYSNYKYASPGRARKRNNSIRVGCPFKLRFSPVDKAAHELKTNIHVKVTNNNLFHSEMCAPSGSSMRASRTNSGYYTSNYLTPENILEIVKRMEDTPELPPTLLRRVLSEYLPDKVTLSSSNLHNFRTRAKAIVASNAIKNLGEVGGDADDDDDDDESMGACDAEGDDGCANFDDEGTDLAADSAVAADLGSGASSAVNASLTSQGNQPSAKKLKQAKFGYGDMMRMANLVANAVGENSEKAEMVTMLLHRVLLKVRGGADSMAESLPAEIDEMFTNFCKSYDSKFAGKKISRGRSNPR